MNFSPKYKTFREWLQNFKGTESYKKRIINLHKRYPDASLAQLRGHPGKRQKPISKLRPKRKRSPVQQIVVQGNAVSVDGNETAGQVYVEVYTRIADKNTDKVIGEVFKELDRRGIKIFRSDSTTDRVSINLRGENFKGGKLVSQKKALEMIAETVEKEMHPAKKEHSHHKKGDGRTGIHDLYRRGYEDE